MNKLHEYTSVRLVQVWRIFSIELYQIRRGGRGRAKHTFLMFVFRMFFSADLAVLSLSRTAMQKLGACAVGSGSAAVVRVFADPHVVSFAELRSGRRWLRAGS